jgi:CDP-paratose 2-epimerase
MSRLNFAMRILITGVCGFVGNVLARGLSEQIPGVEIVGLDNLVRRGSERNLAALAKQGVRFYHADIRNASDFEMLPAVDWVIDAAANASVLAGVDGRMASRQLVEHNLVGTINLLEFCKRQRAGFVLLSTSRVYAIEPLAALEVEVVDRAYRPRAAQRWPVSCSAKGVAESFSTEAPISLYGSSKLASEILALEYAAAFDFPVRINRCGVLAGGGQFGRIDQGIFSFWIHSYTRRQPLRYIGFDGMGHQVRDCLHPKDLVPLLVRQMTERTALVQKPINLGGGMANSMSLAQLSDWCAARFGKHDVQHEPSPRPFDIPWLVLDSSAAQEQWNWRPQTSLEAILVEIADHAKTNSDWLDVSAA